MSSEWSGPERGHPEQREGSRSRLQQPDGASVARLARGRLKVFVAILSLLVLGAAVWLLATTWPRLLPPGIAWVRVTDATIRVDGVPTADQWVFAAADGSGDLLFTSSDWQDQTWYYDCAAKRVSVVPDNTLDGAILLQGTLLMRRQLTTVAASPASIYTHGSVAAKTTIKFRRFPDGMTAGVPPESANHPPLVEVTVPSRIVPAG